MKMTQLQPQDVTNSPKDWDDFWYNSTPINTPKMTTIKANPNASNSELDAKIVINHNNMNDQDYLNLIQLIKDNPHTQNNTYWDNVVNKLYTKVNHSLTNKGNRL